MEVLGPLGIHLVFWSWLFLEGVIWQAGITGTQSIYYVSMKITKKAIQATLSQSHLHLQVDLVKRILVYAMKRISKNARMVEEENA